MEYKPGYTKVENYFFDYVMPRVSCAEWKGICAVIRETVGWNREEAEISIDRFMELTGFARQAVIALLTRARRRSVIERRTVQNGRQRTFRYRAIPRANLKALAEPEPTRFQYPIPFDVLSSTEFENQTPMTASGTVEKASQNATKFEDQTPSRSMKIKLPTGLTEYENQTPNELAPYSGSKDIDLLKENKNEVEKTDLDHQPVEKSKTGVVELCRFCQSQHDDPLSAPAVTLYRERFALTPNEGFRHDIWVTVQDLLLWSEILDGWWYLNGKGRRVEKNPLGIKQMLSAYDEAIRKRGERRA